MIKLKLKDTPREFSLKGYKIRDYGAISFDFENDKINEFITLQTKSGKNCDFTATNWGFYLGPSLNSRLVKEGFKVALVINDTNQLYVMAVENERMEIFKQYLEDSDCKVLTWLDSWCSEDN
jgi:hypothetical protein